MGAIFRKCIILVGILLAVPFWAYGAVGLIKYFNIDDFIREYVGLTMYDNPIKCLISLLVGSLIAYGLKALADRAK